MTYDPYNPIALELKEKITYILCPDDKCKLFWDVSQSLPCLTKCPKLEERVLMIKCDCEPKKKMFNIGDGKGYGWVRIDIRHDDGRVCSHFPEQDFQIMYKMPK